MEYIKIAGVPIKFSLTELQAKHLASIEWLLGDTRADGKTTLMAFVFLKKALENPNRKIDLFDHYPGMQARSLVNYEIERILSSNELLHYFDFGYNAITFRPR